MTTEQEEKGMVSTPQVLPNEIMIRHSITIHKGDCLNINEPVYINIDEPYEINETKDVWNIRNEKVIVSIWKDVKYIHVTVY